MNRNTIAKNSASGVEDEFGLSEEQLAHVNEMSVDEIEDEFITGGNGDPQRLQLLTFLLRRTSLQPAGCSLTGSQVIDRIEQLPIPDVIKRFLNFDISFQTIDDIMID